MSSDRILARAQETLDRVAREGRMVTRARKRQLRTARQKAVRVLLFASAVIIGLAIWGLISPIGIGGIIATGLLLVLGAGLLLALPTGVSGLAKDLPSTNLAMLPLSTEEWLSTQRKSLPAPAQRLVDGIGVKLEILSDQLRTLDEKEPAAQEIRRLIADELPELVTGYQRVPSPLRGKEMNGINPDTQLITGLNVVDSELQRMSEQLARGDLTRLATQGRYLEIKYAEG